MREEDLQKDLDIKRHRFKEETGFEPPASATCDMLHDMMLQFQKHQDRLQAELAEGGARPKEVQLRGTPNQMWEQLKVRIAESKAREENKEIGWVQQKAKELMETQKKLVEDIHRRANIKATQPIAANVQPTTAPTTQPLTGWQHLHQLNMASEAAMQRAGQPTTTITEAYQGNNIKPNPLCVNTSFQYGMPEKGDENKAKMAEGAGAGNREGKDTKVKSGKFAKSHTELLRQEVWPHSAISKKYSKRPTFDNLDFEQFVAWGDENHILHACKRSQPG